MKYEHDSVDQSLRDFAAAAMAVPGWADYASYCQHQERGLRSQAFKLLDRFISKMQLASFDERRHFISWLLHRVEERGGQQKVVPQPLRKRLIEPTCAEWIRLEPESSEPHRWLGFYDHLKIALELNPSDEIAARHFIHLILDCTKYATHELPWGYVGDASEDLQMLAEAEAALPGLGSAEERDELAARIAADLNLIQTYLRRRKDDCR